MQCVAVFHKQLFFVSGPPTVWHFLLIYSSLCFSNRSAVSQLMMTFFRVTISESNDKTSFACRTLPQVCDGQWTVRLSAYFCRLCPTLGFRSHWLIHCSKMFTFISSKSKAQKHKSTYLEMDFLQLDLQVGKPCLIRLDGFPQHIILIFKLLHRTLQSVCLLHQIIIMRILWVWLEQLFS